MKPRDILLPLDGSPDSDAALAVAGALARTTGATAHLLYVVDIPRVAAEAGRRIPGFFELDRLYEFADEQTVALRERGAAILDLAEERLVKLGVRVTRATEHGQPAGLILNHARDADIVVLGRRGETHAAANGQLGLTTERVLRRRPGAVLLAGPTSPQQISRPLLAYDGRAGSHSALVPALELAQSMGVELTIFQIPSDDAEDERRRAQRHVGAYSVDVRWVEAAPGRPAAEAILAAAAEWKHDLVILGPWGYGAEPTTLGDSPVIEIARRAQAPVLITS